ncbi:unnamed protein product [Mytilus coruscus]|uniref:Reverse transcriptase domain-containing protein n=1 Tax=Mytilus coruscus TaxID=42192 RepID=A0A6J8EQZ3_MYTCO|nr:unnamed protein product [Mytilus coruscus]
MAPTFEECNKDAIFVRESLLSAGFLINEKKSIFTPVQELEWLGIIWNSLEFCVTIPDRRINDLICSLSDALFIFNTLSARRLAQVVGKIISMSPVIGNISRLKTRYSYMCIESRISWDTVLNMEIPVQVKDELLFWLDNIERVNAQKLDFYRKSTVMVFLDTSNIACGAYTVEFNTRIFHQMWNRSEMQLSATWREMKAIEQSLISFKNVFKGSLQITKIV